MILSLILWSIASALAVEQDASQDCPTCILANTTCYNVTHLLDLDANFRKRVVIPKMAILRSKNQLFYSFEPVIYATKEYYKTGFVNLDDGTSGIIDQEQQILNFGTFDIDQDNNKIYFGGSDGIWVLDANTQNMSPYSSRGDTITSIFYKNKVYFSKYDEKGIIVKNGDYFRILFDKIVVKNFVVTKYDVFVFLVNTGLYIGKGDSVFRLSKNAYFRGITIDLDGSVYAWWIDGIYKVDIKKNLEYSRLVRVIKIADIGAMTFDNDNNILFTSDQSLYIMKVTDTGCGVVKE